jgi:PDZ domain/Aspartyl protease
MKRLWVLVFVASACKSPPPPAAGIDVPFEVLGNAIYMSARLNGRGPFLFAVDTGSCCSLFASELVGELGLTPHGESLGMGAGSSANKMGLVKGKIEFELAGGVKLTTEDANTVAMAPLWALPGRKVYGDIGYDTLKDYVVRLDYDRHVATFYAPATYAHVGSGQVLGATLAMNYDPQIAGSFTAPGLAPIATRFTLDTGAGGTIITTPLIAEHKLLDHVVRRIASPSHGIGDGTSNDLVGRIDAISLGPYTLHQPVVALSQDTTGSLAMPALAVNLGGNILRRFTVTIDYPKHTVALEPNAHFADPFLADASGLVLEARGDDFHTFVVAAVIPESPATEAQLQPGDVITAIDGKPAATYVLWELVDLFKSAGRHLTLSITRDGHPVTCELVLRALV